MSTQTFSQSRGIFSDDPTYGSATLLPVQTTISTPNLDALDTASSPLSPDYHSDRRLDHFPEEIYDLRPTSHLVRFLKVLLGDAGVGQLRKRYLVSRLQQDMRSSHFFDLDGFYGALFGAVRHPDESLPADPMVSTAPSESWDGVTAQDTSYRERLLKLASAIPMGGTLPGLRTAASAIFDCDVEIYEVWSLLDDIGLPTTSVHTWADVVSTYSSYSAMEGQTWDEISGVFVLGESVTNNRSEFIVQPRKQWDSERQRASEEYDAKRVLSRLKPAGTLLTVSPNGIPVHEAAHIAGFAASSEYWEVQATVSPSPTLNQPGDLYAPGDIAPIVEPDGSFVAPRPPFSAKQGERISYNADIVSVQAYEQNRQGTAITDVTDYETVTYGHNVRVVYSGDKAVMTPRQVAAAHYVSDATMVASPYSQSRPQAVSH